MSAKIGRAVVAAALLAVGVGLLVGGVASDPAAVEEKRAASTSTTIGKPASRYPLAAGPTAQEIQLVVFERAYSECASSDLELLAAKYKAAGTSSRAVAAIVARAWASYFSAGADAVEDGRAGCLQGLRDRGS